MVAVLGSVRAWARHFAMRVAGPVCFMCDRGRERGSRFVSGPDLWICEACAAAARRQLAEAAGPPPHVLMAGSAVPAARPSVRCSFCGQASSAWAEGGVVSDGKSICGGCLELCAEIFSEPPDAHAPLRCAACGAELEPEREQCRRCGRPV